MVPSAPARAAIISLEGSLRPRSISDRYCGEIPARAAVGQRFLLLLAQGPEPPAEHFPPERLLGMRFPV